MQRKVGCGKSGPVFPFFTGSVCDTGVYGLDCKLFLFLDGREEEQPEFFYDFVRRNGKISPLYLSASFAGYFWIFDPVRFCQLLSDWVFAGEGRDNGGGCHYAGYLCGDAVFVMDHFEIWVKAL